MSNLKQLRNRVKTIKSTQKITKAMQMVSASKLNKLKAQIIDAESYIKALSFMMTQCSSSEMLEELTVEQQKFFTNQASNKVDLFVVFTSERGLCGSFNSSVLKQVKAAIAESLSLGREIQLIVIGKKGLDGLQKYTSHIAGYFNITKGDKANLALQIKQKMLELITNGKVGSCYIFFSKFRNALMQVPTKHRIMPLETEVFTATKDAQKNTGYEYEGANFIANLINLYISGQINFAILQSGASEEGSRMTAMDNATKNADDMIDRLTLQLNRSRQATITKELIEIISGAEAI